MSNNAYSLVLLSIVALVGGLALLFCQPKPKPVLVPTATATLVATTIIPTATPHPSNTPRPSASPSPPVPAPVVLPSLSPFSTATLPVAGNGNCLPNGCAR